MIEEEISISNIASFRRKARRGPLFRSGTTLIQLRISTGLGAIINKGLGTSRETFGSEMITFTSKSLLLFNLECLCLEKNCLFICYRLTRDHNMVLRIVLEDFKDTHVWVEYGIFKLQSEELKYSLVVDEYRGSIADSFLYHNQQPFSTYDKNNENSTCAESMGSGWWFKK